MKKQKFKEINLALVPIRYGDLQCWAPVDMEDEAILRGKKIITGLAPIDSRSLQQNKLWAVWYSQISRWTNGNQTKDEVKCFCKLHFGIKILASQDPAFKKFYKENIYPLDYEKKMEFVDLIRVTSKFSKDNGMKYQSKIQQYYAEQGLILEVL